MILKWLEVHDILREGFDRSPMFNGRIQSTGPRYCPSIEDKIDRFASKDKHQIFVEPEGWTTEEIYVNGDVNNKVKNILNISFAYVEGESLIMALKDIAVSSGSACTSASLEPSYVLRALGRKDELASSSIRFSFGRFTTDEDIEYTLSLINHAVERLRELSPLWEMYLDGIDLDTVDWQTH